MTVNIHEAKSSLSKLLVAAQNGEEVIIAKAGKPVAFLKPVEEKKERKPGRLAGQIILHEGWDDPIYSEEDLDEIEKNLCEPSRPPMR